jgi:predicted Rossmann-fold nucleotide-binding protein
MKRTSLAYRLGRWVGLVFISLIWFGGGTVVLYLGVAAAQNRGEWMVAVVPTLLAALTYTAAVFMLVRGATVHHR